MPLPAGPQSHRTPRDALGKSANPRPGLGPGCCDTITKGFTRTRRWQWKRSTQSRHPPRARLGKLKITATTAPKKGKARDVSGWVISHLIFKQLFSTRGHNISRIHFARSGGQVCGTSPSRHTSASSLFSTYPNFQCELQVLLTTRIPRTCPILSRVPARVPPLALPR